VARRVFFSFDYSSDVQRALVVRDHWVALGGEAAGFLEEADFDERRWTGDDAVKRWVDAQITRTSVTVVLVGAATCSSPWVEYEIRTSLELGHGVIGIDVSTIEDWDHETSECCGRIPAGRPFYLWNEDDGPNNLAAWIEAAATAAGR
jgi:Thoeris protein ThsB, TIR-like domain